MIKVGSKFISIILTSYCLLYQYGCFSEEKIDISSDPKLVLNMDEMICERIVNSILDIQLLIETFKTNSSKLEQDLRDKHFALFYRYFVDTIELYNDHCIHYETNRYLLRSEDEYGLRAVSVEWGDVAIVSCAFLEKQFKNYVSPCILDFLSIRAKEQTKQFQHDRSLKITWEELGKRCLDWENHIKHFPNTPLLSEVKELQRIYLSTFLVGLSQSRVLHYGSYILDDHDRKGLQIVFEAYQQIVQEHPTSDLAELLEQYLPLLKDSDFRDTNEIQDFLKYRGIPSDYYADYVVDP
jgi:hypothetical protein